MQISLITNASNKIGQRSFVDFADNFLTFDTYKWEFFKARTCKENIKTKNNGNKKNKLQQEKGINLPVNDCITFRRIIK